MPELDPPSIEIKEWNTIKTEQKAFKREAHINRTIAREIRQAVYVVDTSDISIKIARYVQGMNIIHKPILGTRAYIVIVEVILRITNYCQWLAMQSSCVSSRCRNGSSNFADDKSCLPQTKLTPAFDISATSMDGCSGLNRPCAEAGTCGNSNEEAISSKRNSEDDCRITNCVINLLQDIDNDMKFTIKIKKYNSLPEVVNNALIQKGEEFYVLKKDESQDELQAQLPLGLTGWYRSGLRDSGTGSTSSECRTPRARNKSPSSRSGSPISRSGSPSSKSGSPSFRSGSPSSRSGSPSSRSGSPILSNDSSEHVYGMTGLLDSGTPLAGTLEYDSGYAGDIALGQNCLTEKDLTAAGCIHDNYDILEDFRCTQNVRNLRKTIKDGVFMESVIDELCGNAVGDEFLGKNISDELARKTVSAELSEETVSGELSRKTVGAELSGKTATDELFRKTVSDEFSRKTSCKIALDELSRKRAIILSSMLAVRFQDKSDSNLTYKSEVVLPDVCSQPQPKHKCYETNMRDKWRLVADRYTDGEGSRTVAVRSGRYCMCLYPDRCCHKGKDIHSQKTMSTLVTVEMADQTVSRFSTIEMRDQDLDNCLKLLLKFDPCRHITLRHDIQVFHLEPSAVPGSVYIFMNFEVFRLSSFGFNKFSKDGSILVTSLAKSGFYFKSLIEQIICFGCGVIFEESQDSSQSFADSFHHPQCTRHVNNKPLKLWIQDVNLDALTNYFIENGSLIPDLFETPSAVADRSRSGASNDVLKAGPVSHLNMFINDDRSGYASDTIGYTESVKDKCTDNELSIDSSGGRHPFDQSSINDSISLPADLNHTSGVVGEETFDSDRSHLVLTSASRQPVWSGSTASAGSEDGSEAPAEGAVGHTLSLNLDSAAYPHFSIEAARMRSFTAWSPQHTHTPEELAAAGFFYAGYMDCVRCFYCGLGLKFWRPGDIPAYQHAKYRPHCKFNILYKGQDYIDNVQRELRSEQQGVSNGAENQTAPPQPQESLQTTTTTTSPVVGGPQEHEYLNSEAAKDALRNGWTRDQIRQAVNHIVTEYGESCLETELLTDILTHFNTHGETSQNLPGNSAPASIDPGINSTTPQLSIPPASSALLANAMTIHRGGQEVRQGMPDEATPAGASNAGQPEVRVPNPSDILRTVEREHALLEERVTCRLCRSSPVSCIYLPCGHVIACQDCADTATHCVFCKKTIIGTANIFLA